MATVWVIGLKKQANKVRFLRINKHLKNKRLNLFDSISYLLQRIRYPVVKKTSLCDTKGIKMVNKKMSESLIYTKYL